MAADGFRWDRYDTADCNGPTAYPGTADCGTESVAQQINYDLNLTQSFCGPGVSTSDCTPSAGWVCGPTANPANCGSVVIVLPTDTAQAMSWMNAYCGYGPRVVFEFWNEPWTSSNGPAAIPAASYAQEYQAAYNAKHAAGSCSATGASISQPLLFMTTGDPFDTGNMWLESALKAVPNLQVDAFSLHPYGEANQDTGEHSYGVNALQYDHQDAVNHGFVNTPWYVTEFGFMLNPAQAYQVPTNAAAGQYVPSYCEQQKQLVLAYNQMMTYGDGAAGTWLKGILYYQSHDDSTGWFGLITAPTAASLDYAGEAAGTDTSGANTPIMPRPGYAALKGYLTTTSETPPTCSD